MIKRTIEISSEPAHLTVKHDQLLLLPKDDDHAPRATIPCEDIAVVLVEHAGTTFAHAALERLLHHGAVLVICGRDHLPAGMLLPIGEHTELVPRIHQQIAVSKPLRKQLWKQIVQAKIRAQAANLPPRSGAHSKLLALARGVRSGDPSNVEAQGARVYWQVWLDDAGFRRDPGGPAPNNMLNYGYAVMRAAVARAIVSAGLLPALGIQHSRRSNAFCLADDLVEPLRPLVDERVRELHGDGYSELIPEVKRALLELLTARVRTGDQTGPLMVGLHRYVASLVRCYEGAERRLVIPVPKVEMC
ncbi:MAG TPA: type II CRISPR-associated endonuclease Cas1 [Phycisphaerae bacterium]|nr:type II CRISPR-associated endonuclease Cas1 [Phycisphaerae bacterium]